MKDIGGERQIDVSVRRRKRISLHEGRGTRKSKVSRKGRFFRIDIKTHIDRGAKEEMRKEGGKEWEKLGRMGGVGQEGVRGGGVVQVRRWKRVGGGGGGGGGSLSEGVERREGVRRGHGRWGGMGGGEGE